MRISSDIHEKMMAAYGLLGQDIISISTFEHARTLLKGVHPEVDKKLEICSKALDKLQKVQSGDVVTLSAESLPEGTEKQKKRKKALVFFISSLKDLQSEIQRLNGELQSSENSAWHWGRIIKFAKGPFGLVTLAALLIVIAMPFFKQTKPSVVTTKARISPTSAKQTIQVITYQGKQIPLTQLRIGNPHYPNCDGKHYHALSTTETVTTLDGTVLYDPGNCGFGKVADTQVTTITQ